jgi:hypothetical protein
MARPSASWLAPAFGLAALAPALAAQLAAPADGQPMYLGTGIDGEGTVVAVVDLDADGWPDMLRGSDRMQAFLNNGHAVFRLVPTTGKLPDELHGLACGDLDGDGDVDAVGATENFLGADSVYTFRGDGVGHFPQLSSQGVIDTSRVALADLDLDGALDAVVTHEELGCSLYTLAGLGDGTLAAPVQHGSAGKYGQLDVADWDLDGDPDVIAVSPTLLRVFLWHGGDFDLGPADNGNAEMDVAFGDIDADGWTDALYTAPDLAGDLLIQRRNVAGAFGPKIVLHVEAHGRLAVEQDPLDGYPDVAVGGSWATVQRCENLGGVLSVKPGALVEHAVSSLGLADFDGDGVADPVAGGVVYFPDATGGLPGTPFFSTPGSVGDLHAMRLAQLDGDGEPELVGIDHDGSKLVVGVGVDMATAGGVPFKSWSSIATAPWPVDLVVVDVDGDGAQDAMLLCDAPTNKLLVHRGDGADGFGPGLSTPTLKFPRSLVAGDLDADGVPDAVSIELDSGGTVLDVMSRLGTGTGLFTLAPTHSQASQGVYCVALGDVDGSGFLDAVITGPGGSNGQLLMGQGHGNGGFETLSVVTQDVGIAGDVLTGDFDEEGLTDIVVACKSGHSVALFRQKPTGGFFAPVVSGLPQSGASGLIAADLDDDGHLDLAFDGGPGEVCVVRGDGQGGLHAGTTHPASAAGGLHALAVSDFDHDGRSDVLHLGTDANQLHVLLRQADGDNAWASIGGGIPGASQPRLRGTGEPLAGQSVALDVDRAAALAPAFLILGTALLDQPFKGGHLVPMPLLTLAVGVTDAAGTLHLQDTWPAGVPAGMDFWLQIFLPDPAAAHALSATGGLRLRVP